ncbi:MAG: DUF1294 domain-containing protein [Lachnospiraceae bacterium]|nr:DUF1294 domain-containing protein [Lachnospiraceae bacterium]MCD7841847.1 DUF1294 domain-containing protein [Lachnospiraceae bacterium]
MKSILIFYIIMINLVSLILMGTDKLRAQRGKQRIPERTLFIAAILFGSIGIFTGMYVFHHKTRKLKFSIGIPFIFVIQLLLVTGVYLWNKQEMARPTQAVQQELSLIQELDEATITSFVSYESLMNSNLATGEISTDATEAVDLFFENFTYSIHNEEIIGDEAAVTVQISNIDAKELARDLCTEILKNSVEIYPDDEEETTTGDYYRLLRDTLSSNNYNIVVSTAVFHLKRENNSWTIQSDSELEDDLVGGFISCMNDPYILSASEVLAIHLDALLDLNADDWMEYLDIEDVFATYNTEYYSLIDEEYVRQLTDAFDYEILRCTEDGDQAEAVVRVTSVDMTSVLTAYRESLLAYASTTQSIRDSSVTFSNETSRMLLEALQENTSTVSTDVTLTFSNNGSTWEVYFNSDFTDALMGNMNEAIEAFSSTNEDAAQEVTPTE